MPVLFLLLLGMMTFTARASPDFELPGAVMFNELAAQCAPEVDADTLQAIARTESAFNPYAIGVVNGVIKQPTTHAEATAAAKQLAADGHNFSMGLAQINRYNLKKYDLDYDSVFDPCRNLKTGAAILTECFSRAKGAPQEKLQQALSCYYSGNFSTGFTQDLPGQPSYVERVLLAAKNNHEQQTIVPKLDTTQPANNAKAAKASVKRPAKKPPSSEKKESDAPKRPAAEWDAFADW